VDPSALVKLAIKERGSPELERRLRGEVLVSSALARVEVGRAIMRTERARPRAPGSVTGLATLIDVDEPILRIAASLDPRKLRTLDAIHLATALLLADGVDAFVTYDRQLGVAAAAAGLAVEAPGA